MIYDTLSKGEDGLYHSRALNDEKKRHFIQLNGVSVSDVDQETGEVSFEVTGEDNQAKVEFVHNTNLQSALENSKTWFGKELPEKTVSGAYTRSENLETDRISATRIFDHKKEPVEFNSVSVGMTCTAVIEFSGLWFAKKAFGPTWNIVQLKIHEEKIPEAEAEVEQEETYPDQYMIQDSE
tara:strand:- start:202 stop:744 length:543 start_codon:yes stop_codon:yes gene_type:complete